MIDQLTDRAPEQGSFDPLDVQLDCVRAAAVGVDGVSTRTQPERRAWSGGLQILVLLFAGIALGRHGLGILSDSTLSLLDPVIPVALAALGVLAAFEIGTTPWIRSRLIAGVGVQAVMAAIVVAAGTLAFVQFTGDSTYASPWVLAIVLGVCASPSSALATGAAARRSGLTRLIDLDALPAIIAGGLVIVVMRERDLGRRRSSSPPRWLASRSPLRLPAGCSSHEPGPIPNSVSSAWPHCSCWAASPTICRCRR